MTAVPGRFHSTQDLPGHALEAWCHQKVSLNHKSCLCRTFSCRFFRMGVSRGSRSLMGGVILVMPMTLTIDCTGGTCHIRGRCTAG